MTNLPSNRIRNCTLLLLLEYYIRQSFPYVSTLCAVHRSACCGSMGHCWRAYASGDSSRSFGSLIMCPHRAIKSHVSHRAASQCTVLVLLQPGYAEDYLSTGQVQVVPGAAKEATSPATNRRLWHSQPEFRQPGAPPVKLRDCIICHQLQSLRAKHCHDCNKCVLTFDHHCPFMGCCIGEKNRALFFLYLIAQVASLAVAAVQIEQVMKIHHMEYPIAFLFVLVLAIAILTGCLLSFHIYLMIKGLTTWEYFSWSNITYMQKIGHLSNPFNRGILRNIKEYWQGTFLSRPVVWEFVGLTDSKWIVLRWSCFMMALLEGIKWAWMLYNWILLTIVWSSLGELDFEIVKLRDFARNWSDRFISNTITHDSPLILSLPYSLPKGSGREVTA